MFKKKLKVRDVLKFECTFGYRKTNPLIIICTETLIETNNM